MIKYVKEHLPFEPPDTITGSIKTRRDDVIVRAYGACYMPACELVSHILKMPRERQKQILLRPA